MFRWLTSAEVNRYPVLPTRVLFFYVLLLLDDFIYCRIAPGWFQTPGAKRSIFHVMMTVVLLIELLLFFFL